MILLQASICASTGVPSLVQSGPSCARDWARAGADHSAVATIASNRIQRCISQAPGRRLACHCEFGTGLRPVLMDETAALSPLPQGASLHLSPWGPMGEV